MTTSAFVRGTGALLLALGAVAVAWTAPPAPSGPAPDKGRETPANGYTLSGPYVHQNLTLFLIHGPDNLKDRTFLTLDEALEQKKIVVHETKNVNELAVENVSTEEVFIPAGDIVKGGQQDRVVSIDFIVPPKSGKLPIAVFCVESGRWSQRGQEMAGSFASSKEQLATKELKLAARKDSSQSEVWRKVARCQTLLGKNLNHSVQAADSASSLQLTLEDKKLLEAVDAYSKDLATILDKEKDVIGYAFAINGQVNSADVYASPALFRKLWPKFLKATVVEAVSEFDKDKKFGPVTADAMKAFLADAEKGKATTKDVTKRIQSIEHESEKNLLFETRDQEQKGVSLRRSYIAR